MEPVRLPQSDCMSHGTTLILIGRIECCGEGSGEDFGLEEALLVEPREEAYFLFLLCEVELVALIVLGL